MEVDSNLVEEFKHLNKENVEFRKKCAQLAQEITSGQLSIVKLVEELGALLVDVSPSNRELGTWVLTHVLEGLPAKHFDKKQLDFICAFYIDRLKDHHQVVPAVLVGVLALAKFNHFPDGAASQILSAIFQNVACQQQQERDRNNIYKIFEVLLDKCETELCAVGLDYVCGIISAVDGERNPRNLVLLFNWFPKFLKTVNLGHLTEETFEILACYFPVDFKAPTQDPNPITRETLADSLAPCLTAIPQFAEFCFSLALEKLDSSLEIAKLDSLKLLEMGCLTFDNTSYVQHSTEIWSQIQKELFNTPAPVVEAACLSTLVAVIKKISLDSSLNSTVKDISDTLKGNLLPDSRLFEPSAKILLNAAKASHTSCTIISKEIVPILINTFNITTTATHKVALLNVLINFFESSVKLYKLEFDELNKIPILCLKASVDENDSLRKIGFDGLRQISQFLSIDLRYSVYDNLQKLLLIPQTNDVRNLILNCLDELAKNYPNEVKEKLIGVGEITNVQTLEAYLDALSVIVIQGFFTNTVVDILFEYLRKNVSLGQTAVNSLKNILLKHDGDENVLSVLIERGTISTLVDWFLSEEDNLGAESVESVAFILKSIIGNQSSDRQREILFKEFPKVDLIKSVRIFVLDGLLCRLRRDVQIDYKILDDLMALIRTKNNDFVKNVAVQLLSNLLNKCDENTLQNYLTRYESNNDITTMSWITKALVMRNHEKANLWTDKLVTLLDENREVAGSFRIVMNDNFDALSLKSNCIRMLLYQQKFFTVVSNRLYENYRPDRGSYLVALGYLLEFTPKQAILLQFKKLLKLIILCLDECEESEVVTVLLQIIKDFIVRKESCIEDHLSEFLTRFLKLSATNKSMKVRILALQCLEECTSSFPIYKLLLHKQEVLSILGKVIDDKKRIVRREAVEARSSWFLLDAPI